MIQFRVDMKPTGKGRPRSYLDRLTGRVSVYTDSKTATAERSVAYKAREAMTWHNPITTACAVEIEAFYALPKSTSKKREMLEVGKPATTKPDVDNVAKLVLDAMNGIVYEDDRLVSDLVIRKRKSEIGSDAILIRVRSMEDESCL